MMMKASVSMRTVSVRQSRRALVVANSQAGRKTVGGRKSGASIAEERTAYLKSLPGVSEPFPEVFDPASLSATASIEDLRRWRESEITHGRVAMLAAVGFLVGEQVQDNQFLYNFDGKVEGPAITHWNQLGQGFWEPLLIFIGLAETYRVNVGWATPTSEGFNTLKDDYEMGNLGFDPLGICPEDPEERKTMQTKELNNGRLAMIGIAGFVLQEVAEPGVEIFEHLFYNIEVEAVREIDDIERAVGLPLTPLPK